MTLRYRSNKLDGSERSAVCAAPGAVALVTGANTIFWILDNSCRVWGAWGFKDIANPVRYVLPPAFFNYEVNLNDNLNNYVDLRDFSQPTVLKKS